jgi:CotH kinase protein/Lamin Tail Domain/PA14 domain
MPRSRLSLFAGLFLSALLGSLPAQVPGVQRELYLNLNREGFSLGQLTNHPSFLAGQPDQTDILSSLRTETNRGEDYGQRLRAYLAAPTTGNYTFWISADETANLLLSTNENPVFKRVIAWVDPRSQENNFTTHYGQQSAPITLQAGQRYYLEVLHHEVNLNDHLAVQWQIPGGALESPIPDTRLVYNIAPLITSNLTNDTVEQGRPAVFAPQVANFIRPNYRWQRNGANLSGETNSTYHIPAVSLADNTATFRCFITNQLGSDTTATATLTVSPDLTPPTVTAVFNGNRTNVLVTFSEAVVAPSAVNLQNYQLPGVTITGAELVAAATNVILTTSPLTPQTSYTLTVSNVLEASGGGHLLAPVQINFTAVEFQAQPVGGGAQAGSVIPVGSGANVTGGGADIGGAADQFQFAWQLITGNFDVRTRVESLDFTDVWARAGLMARESIDADSRFAAAFASPTLAGAFFAQRTDAGGVAVSSGSYPASFPNAWLRLQRTGNLFSGFASQDGENWMPLGSVSVTMSNRLYLGFAVSSHTTNQTMTAQFRDYTPVSGGTIGIAPPRAEPLGPSSRRTGLAISEIMYHPRDVFVGTNKLELEFVELYNSNPFFEDLSGYRLSGDIDYTFPAGTILSGGGFIVVARNPADLQSVSGPANIVGPFANNLPNNNGQVRLRNQNDFVLLEVNYSTKYPWPVAADGAGHSLVLARASYGEGEREAWAASDSIGGSPGRAEPVSAEPLRALVINEFLAHTDEPETDFIELYNRSGQPVDAGGVWLSDNPATNKFRLPSPTLIPAHGFVSFDQNQLGFSLKSSGDRLLLVNSNETRVLDALSFEPQANGISSGRFPDGATTFRELAANTLGSANALLLARDIVINEIMYHPISEDSDDEFVELFNRGASPVNIGGWRFTNGISFEFASNTVIAAGGYLVVAKNQTRLFANYANLNTGNTVGNFTGSLANRGERLALARPELAINADDPLNITTNTVYVVVNEVAYRRGGQWGDWSDGGGSSLELMDPHADNRLAPNWADSDETAKAPWTTIETTGVLDNGGNTPNALHVMLLEAGECLLDDVEVFRSGGGNRIANSSFESNLSDWTMRGNHERSSQENSGYNSFHSLHVRASSRGDPGPNKIYVPLTSALSSGQTATIRAKVRWLRGWPEILLRLRGSYLEATDRMAIPLNLGTPGAPNSRLIPNAGPAITEVTHTPAVPAANQPVVVTARVADPDGVSSLVVKYRLDPATSLTSVPMTNAGEGIFAATIPGQAADKIVAFTIEAADAALPPVASRFPALRDDNGPTRECLVHFGSPTPASSFGTYRFWITAASITNWSQREVLSNERIPGTFVYGNQRVIYNVGARYSGSSAHQDMGGPDYSPVGTPNHYAFDIPGDDLLLGTDNFNKLHGAGNNHHDDNTLQRELTAYWVAAQLGLPINYKRSVAMFINGARRGTLMEDTEVPNGDTIDSVFPNDPDGDLFKLSIWNEFGLTGQALSVNGISEAYLNDYTTTGGVKKRARYRWNFPQRSTHGTANNFTNLYTLVDAVNAPTGADYPGKVNALVDVENWMRTFAVEHAVGNWDSFGYRNQQNMFAYKPENGLWSLLIWDINIVFGGGTRGTPVPTDGSLLEIDSADTGISALYNAPEYQRAYWRALADVVAGPFAPGSADALLNARFAAYAASGVYVDAPEYMKTWISQRRTYILAELAKLDAANFNVSGPASFSTPTNLITLNGVAPVGVRTIAVNGVAWPVTWSTLTNWAVRVTLTQAITPLTILGLDGHGQLVPGASKQVTVTYTGTLPDPGGHVVINEWMAANTSVSGIADPADGDFEDWFELYNPGTNTVDLGGNFLTDDLANSFQFQIPNNGQYTIAPGGYLLVWADGEPDQNATNRADLHVNFSLRAAGEAIGLFAADGTPIDTVTFGAQVNDVSEGRSPDGSTNIAVLPTPSPRGSNNSPPPPPQLSNVLFTGGNQVQFTISTVSGHSYQVEYKDNLGSATWLPLGGARLASGASLIVTDTPVTGPQRFYRVLVLP